MELNRSGNGIHDMKDVSHFTGSIDEATGWRGKLIECRLRCIDIFCLWGDCGFRWELVQRCFCFIVFDPFASLCLTLAVGINTVFMAMDYDGIDQNPTTQDTVKIGNKVRVVWEEPT